MAINESMQAKVPNSVVFNPISEPLRDGLPKKDAVKLLAEKKEAAGAAPLFMHSFALGHFLREQAFGGGRPSRWVDGGRGKCWAKEAGDD